MENSEEMYMKTPEAPQEEIPPIPPEPLCTNKESNLRKPIKLSLPLIAIVVVVVLAIIVFLGLRTVGHQKSKPEVVTISTLERIVDVSELSTFTAVYNGIAEVMNEKDPEKVDYYISYEAKVNAGIDFDAVDFSINSDEKEILINLPPIHISKVNVDIASMDYIFINSKKNDSGITQTAYKACEADAQDESESETAILDLAKQNAENIMRALINPFIEQLDTEYELNFNWKEELR